MWDSNSRGEPLRDRRGRAPLLLGLLPAIALACSSGTARPAGATPGDRPRLVVWVAPALQRVFRGDPPGAAREAALRAARGEYEAFQIVLYAPGGTVTGVELTPSELVGPGGRTIPASSLSIYREHYVDVPRASRAPEGRRRPGPPGVYPDALVPLARAGRTGPARRVDVAPGENQPFWVDVRVPRDAARGLHTGTITVTTDQGRASVPVSLTVWDFELPVVPSLRSSVGLTGPRLRDEAYQRLLIDHKVMPTWLTAGAARALRPGGLEVAGLEYWSDQSGCTLKPPPSADAIRAAVAAYPPGLELYVYVADEPLVKCGDPARVVPQLATWARAAHAAGAKTLVTIPPRPELLDDGTGRSSVDIWVLLPKQLDPADASQATALRHGDQLWWYTALAQDAYSPKWLLDAAPIEYRIGPGFISQSLGLSGVLYWAADHWSGDPWRDVYFHDEGASWAGEGVLVYPGERVGIDGPIPSMRLKWIREGVEDFEYVELLKRRGRGAFALDVARTVGAGWRDWTSDPAALQEARDRLGQELDRLATAARIEPARSGRIEGASDRAPREDSPGTGRVPRR